MGFGKPKLSDTPVRCLNCGEEYPENEIIQKYAGRIHAGDGGGIEEGDYWNSKCPCCGRNNAMQSEYAELSEKEFKEEQHKIARLRQQQRKKQNSKNRRYA